MIDSITSWCTAGSSSPMSNVPPASSRPSSSCVAIGATMPGSRTGVGSVTSRWPLTRSEGMVSGSPSSTGGWPVANTTMPGSMSPADVVTVISRSPRTVTPVAATPVATAGSAAASLTTARSGLTRAWRRISAPSIDRARPGTSCSTWPGASHSTAGGWCAAKPPGCGASPIQSTSTSPTPPPRRCSISRHRSRLACSRSTSGSGSLHRCGSGISRPLAPPVAPVPSRPVSISSTEPSPASWHAAAVATPMIPPPTTRMSGRGSGMEPWPRPSACRSAVVS